MTNLFLASDETNAAEAQSRTQIEKLQQKYSKYESALDNRIATFQFNLVNLDITIQSHLPIKINQIFLTNPYPNH